MSGPDGGRGVRCESTGSHIAATESGTHTSDKQRREQVSTLSAVPQLVGGLLGWRVGSDFTHSRRIGQRVFDAAEVASVARGRLSSVSS